MNEELVDKIEKLFAEQMVTPPPATEPEPIKRWAQIGILDDAVAVTNVLIATPSGAAQLTAHGMDLVELEDDSRVQAGDRYDRATKAFSRPEVAVVVPTEGLDITVAGPDGPVQITLPAEAVGRLADALRAQLSPEK